MGERLMASLPLVNLAWIVSPAPVKIFASTSRRCPAEPGRGLSGKKTGVAPLFLAWVEKRQR